MEIFMRNINWSFNQNNVITQLAEILHGDDFPPGRINFHVRLQPDPTRTRNHKGFGWLTLPNREIGLRFLSLVSTNSSPHRLVLDGKQVSFSLSKQAEGRPDVVESIKRLPYIDPFVNEERTRRAARLSSEAISVRSLQFGWECRDGVFSIEWEAVLPGHCDLTFTRDGDGKDIRQLQIQLKYEDRSYRIAMPYSTINTISIHHYLSDSEPVIFFSLNTPPSYEYKLPNQLSKQNLRQRLSSLPFGDHQRVAPYTSNAIRLVCDSSRDISIFRNLCGVAQLHHVYDWEYPIEYRGLFSNSLLQRYHTWLEQLDWPVAFQLMALIQNLYLDLTELLNLRPTITRILASHGSQYTIDMLRKFGALLNKSWNEDEDAEAFNVRRLLDEARPKQVQVATPAREDALDRNLCQVLHVLITPSSMLFEGPTIERSNRVIRQYDIKHQQSFLRVSFVDEGKLNYRFDREIDKSHFIQTRVGPFLLDGLMIANRRFTFLAYSQSALKEHAVWFVKPFTDSNMGFVDASTIIRNIGSFDNLQYDPQLRSCPARYAARLSQAFTATDVSITVQTEETFFPDDIHTADNKYQFTDGVGTISLELATEIAELQKEIRRRGRSNKNRPKAFQIRFGGSKGMLSVDYTLKGRAICLRPSMIKFEADHSRDIEIARAFDRPGPYFLNRPLVMMLEGLGVPFETFLHYQNMAVEETKRSTHSLRQAATILERYGLGVSYRLPSILLNLEKLYISSPPNNTFYEKMLEFAMNHVLRQLKNHARIPVPGAWTLVGVADVHQFLGPKEIFACVKPVNGKAIYLEGPILISRSPTIHPGDVMIVRAIGRPPVGSSFEREPLPNTVVFSTLGHRPVPSCLGGGDLDGDVYNLIPLNTLPEFAPRILSAPASYEPVAKKTVDHPSTMKDVAEFVMEYIVSDVVGIIATNWLIVADQTQISRASSVLEDEVGIFHPDCLKLADLHSNAVDYPKSGRPVPLTEIPRLAFPRKPDWNAPETVDPEAGDYYESVTAVGRLFRAVDLLIENLQRREPRHRTRRRNTHGRTRGIDLVDGFRRLGLEEARGNRLFAALEDRVDDYIRIDPNGPSGGEEILIEQLFDQYCSELRGICAANSLSHARNHPLTEEEAIIGTIAQKSSQPRKRKDAMSKLREGTGILVRGIRESLAGDDAVSSEKSLERAWFAWEYAWGRKAEFGAQSFGWIALGAIFEAIKEIDDQDRGRSHETWH